MSYQADPSLVVKILRAKAQTTGDKLLQSQLEAAFWEAIATAPVDVVQEESEPETEGTDD